MKQWNNASIKVKDGSGNWNVVPGVAGESAYEIAVRRGHFSGTEAEWLNALETERAAAITSIENKGTTTLASIPSDYTTLSNNVSSLSDEVEAIGDAIGACGPSANLLNTAEFEDGYYSSGVWTESATYETSDYFEVTEGETLYIHVFNLSSGNTQDNLASFQYIYWFNSNKEYANRTTFSTGTTTYAVPNGAVYGRVMGAASVINGHLANSRGMYVGLTNTTTWVAYDPGGYPDIAGKIEALNNAVKTAKVSKSGNVYTITTNKGIFVFQLVTKADENLNTWRLYQGQIKNGNTLFTMWRDSDAEGVVSIAGESDFVGGFHGSEQMTGIKVFMDGVDVTSRSTLSDEIFNVLTFCVDSDVYHCYQDADADTVAFKRSKIVEFTPEKVTISNCYTAQSDLTITTAPLALFQCYKSVDNVDVFTDFSVNSDYKNYAVSTISTSSPESGAAITAATLNTTLGRISVKVNQTSGQNYSGKVQNFGSQNRVKFYFYTIASSTAIQSGEKLTCQFEFEIK